MPTRVRVHPKVGFIGCLLGSASPGAQVGAACADGQGGQVEAQAAVEDMLVGDQAICRRWSNATLGNRVLGRGAKHRVTRCMGRTKSAS